MEQQDVLSTEKHSLRLYFQKSRRKVPKICSVTETRGDVASCVTVTWKESSTFTYTKIKLKIY